MQLPIFKFPNNILSFFINYHILPDLLLNYKTEFLPPVLNTPVLNMAPNLHKTPSCFF